MSKYISTKTKWVSTDGWRGYSEPINAVGGANNTGTWSDSPCPSNICEDEVKRFRQLLRKEKIKSRAIYCQTSNVFCMHLYVLVSPEDKDRAKVIAEAHQRDCRLFYAV